MIYLDNNATTRVDDEVIKSMIPFFSHVYGNPSSILNAFGHDASEAVDGVKKTLMRHFHAASQDDFIFTSGATESNNMALCGLSEYYKNRKVHFITTNIEHASVLKTCEYLESKGINCTYVPVKENGVVDPEDVEKAITDNTVLITVMGANNEIGTIQPLFQISELAQRHNILFHSDVSQYIGYNDIDLNDTKIDMMSFSAHKIHGPKGIGVLYANRKSRRRLKSLVYGGGQQNGLRSGTLNVPGIVGLGKAIEIIERDGNKNYCFVSKLQKEFLRLLSNLNITINGDIEHRIPNNINVTINNASAQFLMSSLPELAFSTKSACSSGTDTHSYVLKAIGLSDEQIENTIRMGISKYTTMEDIQTVVKRINEVVSGY